MKKTYHTIYHFSSYSPFLGYGPEDNEKKDIYIESKTKEEAIDYLQYHGYFDIVFVKSFTTIKIYE